MSLLAPLGLGGLAILMMVVFTWVAARRQHRRAIAAATPSHHATADGPRILIHDINDDRCTGCDACVAVCPTNVLDLVANKSRVLRFHDCIQCEACMIACPTEALVMFPKGTTPPPLKVPELDEHYQTAVPGQYLIGEVAGKPLVKNAANLGRAVVEHMLATGLRAGAVGHGETTVDVAIVGSGPGGLSAALTCIQRGLSYVVLDKEQTVASTIARYPKGKLVMAEPYRTTNVSFLPVFDGAKEVVIAVWQELFARVGLAVKIGESVEGVARGADGVFDVRTTVARYRAQRVVLSIGTRGKPRTLGVPGENLPKIRSLLEDPDEWRGRPVLVVGGGDSACEAAFALADAGARVIVSYRGRSFHRAAPTNRATMEAYAAEGRVRAFLSSQVLGFEHDAVILALHDGSQRRFPNAAAFVLIGADPPVAWLETVGIRCVERHHQYTLGDTDDLVRRYGPAVACPEDAARAAAQITGAVDEVAPAAPPSGPRKWLQSATSIFRPRTHPGLVPPPAGLATSPAATPPTGARRAPFGPNAATIIVHHAHSGSGRRDQLSVNERTRILRTLRDDGARLADEDELLYIGTAPATRFDVGTLEPNRAAPMPIRRTPVPVVDDDERVHIGTRPATPLPVASDDPDPIPDLSDTVLTPQRWPTDVPSTEPRATAARGSGADLDAPSVRPRFVASIGNAPSVTGDDDEDGNGNGNDDGEPRGL